MSQITLNIEGMHCDACVRRVGRALHNVVGTVVEEVRLGTARVQSEEIAPLLAALAKAGYTAHAERQ
ncbi:MAG TPA: heavy-metal-associated domain-containing protein [Silvibacterium sp.]|nr:heavy-metal-associated domain-containing protein [Silvibacterium sp.]